MPPEVAAVHHGDVLAGALNDEHMLDARGLLHGLVDVDLEPAGLAAPVAAIGGDDQLRLRVVDAVGECLGREAAEDDGVRRADAGAGEHRDRQLRNHRHVDGDAIAAPHTELLNALAARFTSSKRSSVGDDLAVSRLALPVEGDLVTAPGIDVAIEAVYGDIELATVEPLGEGGIPLQDSVPGAIPIELCRFFGPKPLWVGRGPFIDRRVVDICLSREIRPEAETVRCSRNSVSMATSRVPGPDPGCRAPVGSSLISLPRIVGGNGSRCRATG